MYTERIRTSGRGLLSQVKPVFLIPAVATSLFGGLLAQEFALIPGILHGWAVGLALYTAHLKDGYVDGHVRGEEQPTLSPRENQVAIRMTSASFLITMVALWWYASLAAVLVTAPLWILALLHAPYLDMHPVTVTVDYPIGIGLAVVGGYFVQTGQLPARILGVSVMFVVLLSGVKVSTDRLDYTFDQSIGKRTVPVLLGNDAANVVAATFFFSTSLLVVGLVNAGLFPPITAVAGVLPLFAASVGFVGSRRGTVRVQMFLTYPFAAILFSTYCWSTHCSVIQVLDLLRFTLIELPLLWV
ncbi:UbiA family prenyltransferase [Haladaptatus pallidirubidus]|uniref:Ubiquinone biosynthesis protein UbiA n=1 Tax=Haladaptatus pallidirubidus TaxID=1008152 RepID=A0AAV3UNP7_9EURY|nr:UbiA family prenyltransferase [Haladaptatus pallidirubidus]